MDALKIYHANGKLLKDENGTEITIKSLTYTGSWMGECFVSVTFKNPAPINFSIGDYLTYRGEVFEINYDPGKIKSSSRNSTGEAFTYDSVKFNSKQYELVRAEFLDIVLDDNETHYTSLTKFPFYVQSVDDLLDRIQANLDEQYGAAVWKLYSRNKTRSEQRRCLPEEWVNVYGEGIADNVIKSTSITVDGKTCWDALALVNSQFGINFIVRGRNVYVGTAGVPTSIIFEYGKGNGLYEIEQNADSEQSITTRLRAYGSTKNMPSRYYAKDGSTLPNNMAVNNLMLPGFPNQSLQEWWNAQTTETKNRIYSGSKEHRFSDNKYRPFVDSANINEIGVRPNSIYFDTENLEEGIIEIYPTIEEMEVDGVRIDVVESADVIEDNGVFKDGETVPNFHIYLNSAIDFDINDLIKKSTETPYISMKDGMCGAREFQINSAKKLSDGRWELTCQRQADESLNLYFPYNDYKIIGGDHFVLIGIPLPDSYVTAASIKLLKYALEFLDKNDYTRYVYSPKIDEIFMARQHDAAMADTTGTIQSIHDTIKEGDFMQFTDNDLGIEGSVTIDQLTIKEEDGKIPAYEVTLREDKSVGTIQKIQNKISSIESGNGGLLGAGGATSQQIQKLIESYGGKRFLSKLSPDTAQGLITFLNGLTSQEVATLMKGIAIGTAGYGIDAEGVAQLKALFLDKASINAEGVAQLKTLLLENASIDADGNAVVGSVKSADYRSGLLDGRGFGMYCETGTGIAVAEVDKLNVRKKAVFAKLEVREFAFTSGDVGYTSAGCKIDKVTQQLDSGNYRCYWLAELDGVKIENAWHVGDQAMCRTSNIISKDTSMAANRYYWRLVVDKGEEMIDGKVYHYIDLSNTNGTLTLTIDGKDYPSCVGYDTSVNNDAPQAEDSIVQLGSQTDPDRQYAYVVYVSEGKRVDYDGINGYDLDSHIVEIHSREVNYMRSERFELVTGSNIHVPLVTERGAWTEGTTAYHYDHFSYSNATWLCIVGKGQSTTEAPNEESGKWVKETYGVKGDAGTTYTGLRLTSTSLSVRIDKGGSVVMPGDIIVRAAVSNLTGTPEWSIIGSNGTSIDSGTIANKISDDGLKLTIVQAMMMTAFETNGWTYARVTCSLGGYTDYVTILPVRDGETGNDAVSVRLVPDKVVVDTDSTGHVTETQLTNAYTMVEVRKGATAYASFTIGTPTTSSGIECSVNNPKVKVDSIGDDPSTIINDDPSTGYAYGSGYIDIPVTVDSVDYTVRLTVETNIHKVVAALKQSTDSISLSVNSLTYKVDGYKEETDAKITAADGRITQNVTAVDNLGTRVSNVEQKANGLTSTVSDYKTAADANIDSLQEQIDSQSEDIEDNATAISTISQKADSISMKVSEKMLAGNMLTGTMFRRESEVTWNNPAYKGIISTAVQLGGVNSVYLESTSEDAIYKGVKWAKIPVTAGKTYSLSFWYRTSDTSSNGNFTVMVNAYKADGMSAEASKPINVTALPITDNNVWQLYKGSMTLGSDVAAVDVMIYLETKGKMYIARPMLIEGSYVGWQRSEQDYDYTGGNLLDETKTLTKRGNLVDRAGVVEANAFGFCSSVRANPTTGYTNMLTWRFDYDLNADYTLSFMAKGTGNLDVYLFNDKLDVSLLSEFSGQQRNTTDGNATIVLTPEWKRHTVRWRTQSARTLAWSYLQLRVFAGKDVNDVNEAYIAQPKLEKGCVATAWTEDDGDMVSTKALLATGIDIKNRKVTITSDNVQVQNNLGLKTFDIDENGNIVGYGDATINGRLLATEVLANLVMLNYYGGDTSNKPTLPEGFVYHYQNPSNSSAYVAYYYLPIVAENKVIHKRIICAGDTPYSYQTVHLEANYDGDITARNDNTGTSQIIISSNPNFTFRQSDGKKYLSLSCGIFDLYGMNKDGYTVWYVVDSTPLQYTTDSNGNVTAIVKNSLLTIGS